MIQRGHFHAAGPLLGVAALLLGLATAWPVQAQPNREEPEITWRESNVPPAPAFSNARMVHIDMPIYSEIQVGVDVNTVRVSSKDGVVRYVTVVQGRDGAMAAYYQGVHCNSFQGRTYARYHFESQPPRWENVEESWHDLKEKKSRYARAVAQSGACENYVAAPNTAQAQRAYLRNTKWRGASVQGVAAPADSTALPAQLAQP